MYTVTDVSTRNNDELNRLVAEYIMGEAEPAYKPNKIDFRDTIFSEHGNWICAPQYGLEHKCVWTPVNFSGVLKWTWKVVRKMNTEEPEQIKINFHNFLDKFFPLGAANESDCCRVICQAALLAKL